jgi:flavodoxin
MKHVILCFLIIFGFLCGTAFAQDASKGSDVLVVYFSISGHTEKVANLIHDKVGGDIVKIEVAEPYPAEEDAFMAVAKKGQEEYARPPIKPEIPDIAKYKTVYIGFPIWWSQLAMPIATFVEGADLKGKTIAPFCTSGSGRHGNSLEYLKGLAPNSTMLDILSIQNDGGSELDAKVTEWLKAAAPAK